jgi:hypothetical protein
LFAYQPDATDTMRPEPTLLEKIATLTDLEEVDGFEEQARKQGIVTTDAQGAIATKRAELMRKKINR